ncbi:PREDICTED: putative uncharacterized protein ENSP00000383407 [Tinamus guttatus]|uniref:putative uncharacterized protein ENSP00000383407 n=1 Tax=Tinamus guttatus TaxID=94827 RepID=UPI00052E9F7F|nr:PREDICTED: putative uncharacterized protein ENSP00000383407 [Tinamus guttatus]
MEEERARVPPQCEDRLYSPQNNIQTNSGTREKQKLQLLVHPLRVKAGVNDCQLTTLLSVRVTLEGSMDSLYEPVPEHQEPKDAITTSSRASSPVNTCVSSGTPDRSMSLEFPDFGNTVTKKRNKNRIVKLIALKAKKYQWFQKGASINIISSIKNNGSFVATSQGNPPAYRKNVNGTLWQGSREPENDSYIRRHCQLEEFTEGNVTGDGLHFLRGKKIEETTCQVINYEQWIPPRVQSPSVASNGEMGTEPDDKAESMGTLKRLQKLVRTKKTSMHSMEDVKHVLIPLNTLEDAYLSEEDEETLTSCMKLSKPQEKKIWKDNVRRKEETETRIRGDFDEEKERSQVAADQDTFITLITLLQKCVRSSDGYMSSTIMTMVLRSFSDHVDFALLLVSLAFLLDNPSLSVCL